MAVLLLIADRCQRIRWYSVPKPLGIEIRYLANGEWYEMIPPSWRMRHLVKRMIVLTARNWWDRWQLSRQHRLFVRKGVPLAWERPVQVRLHYDLIPILCRVRCDANQSEVEVEIPETSEQVCAAAIEAVPGFTKLVCETWSHENCEYWQR